MNKQFSAVSLTSVAYLLHFQLQLLVSFLNEPLQSHNCISGFAVVPAVLRTLCILLAFQ